MVYFIFLSNGGPPERRETRQKFFPLPLPFNGLRVKGQEAFCSSPFIIISSKRPGTNNHPLSTSICVYNAEQQTQGRIKTQLGRMLLFRPIKGLSVSGIQKRLRGPRLRYRQYLSCLRSKISLHLRCAVIPNGFGAESQPKSNLVHFCFKQRRLVATILIIFARIN